MTIGRGGDPLLEKGFPAPPKPSPPLPKTFTSGGEGKAAPFPALFTLQGVKQWE